MKKVFVFALCDRSGSFNGLLTLNENEIITMSEEENDDGTYYLEWVDEGESKNYFYSEYVTINR